MTAEEFRNKTKAGAKLNKVLEQYEADGTTMEYEAEKFAEAYAKQQNASLLEEKEKLTKQLKSQKEDIKQWLIDEDYEGLAESL